MLERFNVTVAAGSLVPIVLLVTGTPVSVVVMATPQSISAAGHCSVGLSTSSMTHTCRQVQGDGTMGGSNSAWSWTASTGALQVARGVVAMAAGLVTVVPTVNTNSVPVDLILEVI